MSLLLHFNKSSSSVVGVGDDEICIASPGRKGDPPRLQTDGAGTESADETETFGSSGPWSGLADGAGRGGGPGGGGWP